ncbi:MAG: CoA transferase [Dehalococcoidia bacterium]|nr:CoA transferase [Dehalococcoidia bacterium]
MDVFPCEGKMKTTPISIQSEEQWQALYELLSAEGLALPAKIRTDADRVLEKEAIREVIKHWTLRRTKDDAFNALQTLNLVRSGPRVTASYCPMSI